MRGFVTTSPQSSERVWAFVTPLSTTRLRVERPPGGSAQRHGRRADAARVLGQCWSEILHAR
jgi:hypothetical protein